MSDNLVLVALLFLLTSNSTISSTQLFLLLALLTTTNCSNLLPRQDKEHAPEDISGACFSVPSGHCFVRILYQDGDRRALPAVAVALRNAASRDSQPEIGFRPQHNAISRRGERTADGNPAVQISVCINRLTG